jgi:4-amino-4-deoxy-L-arabinose transferase-like glycosyltransferase
MLNSDFDFNERNKSRLLILFLCLLGLTGTLLFLWGTSPHGIGILSDSVDYIWSARNLARGIGLGTLDAHGVFVPMTVEPPLYSALLSVFELTGIGAIAGARWLGAILFGVLLILFGVILARLTDHSFWFTLVGVLLLMVIPATWITTLYAMTEPVYLVLTLTGLLCLEAYLSHEKRRWLIAAAILFGLALLARYIGLSMIAAGMLLLVFQSRREIKRYLVNALLLGCISVLPTLAWITRNQILAQTATNYDIRFIPISSQEWALFFSALTSWMPPLAVFNNLLPLLIGFLLVLPVAFIFTKKRKNSPLTRTRLPLLLAIYALFFIAFTIASRWIAYPLVTFYQDRILFPGLACLFCLTLYGLYLIYRRVLARSSILATLLTGILGVVALSFAINGSVLYPQGLKPLLISRNHGLGMQNQPENLVYFQKQIAALKVGNIFFTDDTQRLYFYTGVSSFFIEDMAPTDYAQIPSKMAGDAAALVFFRDTPDLRKVLQKQLPGLEIIYSDDLLQDGTRFTVYLLK